jgi:DNA processing protein
LISSLTYKLLAVSKVRGVGKKTLQSFVGDKLFYETPLEGLSSEFSELSSISPGSPAFNQIRKSADADVAAAEKFGDHILGVQDSLYPKLLLTTSDLPLIIFVRGDPNNFSEKALAVIGTREPSAHGQITCERITRYFVGNRWQIVSGLAIGLDTVAHKTTLENSGSTVAVLAHGLDSIYPKQNQKLAEEIVEKDGLLLSEYPYGTPSFPSNFVERDRIQAGLARAVIMIQSDETGGSWHASRASIRYGRQLIVPRPTESDLSNDYPKSRGNRFLIDSSPEKRAAFLKCPAGANLDKQLVFVYSKEDYPVVEASLLNLENNASGAITSRSIKFA